MRYITDFDVLVGKEGGALGENLVVTSDGKPVSSISRTCLAFWNRRGDTVRGTDIVESDPLRIELNAGDKLLQRRIISTSRDQIGFDVIPDATTSSALLITFDFLDVGDGAIFEVIHEADLPPTVEGTIRGADVRSGSSADLSPRSLRVLLEPSRWRRVKVAFSAQGARQAVADLVAISLGFSIFALFLRELLKKRNELVDPALYNLHTLDGQGHFANRVFSVGQTSSGDRLGLLMGALAGVVILVMMYTTVRRRRPPIPATLLRRVYYPSLLNSRPVRQD